MDANYQLAHGEGLADVVLGPELEAADHVLRSGAGREEEHRDIVAAYSFHAQPLDEGESVHCGHHDVGDHDLRPEFRRSPQSVRTVVGAAHLEALLREGVGDDARQGPLVLDEEQPYSVIRVFHCPECL